MPDITHIDASEEILYTGFLWQIGETPDGQHVLTFKVNGNKEVGFAMSSETREKIGKALTAPRVITPNGDH
jgi:hypothetical protein